MKQTNVGHFSEFFPQEFAISGKRGRFRAKGHKIKVVGNAILKTVEKDQFRAFFRMVPQKLAICGKRRRFREKGYFTKVVGNAILKIFYFITFYSRTHPSATNDG